MKIFKWIKSLLMCLLLLGMVSCIKDNISENDTIKAYLYVDVVSRTDGATNPGDQIYHLKVCAYNQNNELVGYKEVTQNTNQAIEMDLTESGPITFLVAANEEYGTSEAISLDYTQFLATGLSGFYEHDGVYAPPMSNPERKSDGSSNRVFMVEENVCTQVNILLERAVSRVCFYFAKTEESEDLKILSMKLNRGVGCGYLFLSGDASDYKTYTQEQINKIFTTRPTLKEEILNSSLVIENVVTDNISADNSRQGSLTYIFPCPYGSSSPDRFIWEETTDYGSAYSYYVELQYEVDGQKFVKNVFLPPVGQNQTVNVLCKIPPAGKDVQVEFNVYVQNWIPVTNPDISFD